MTPNTALEPTAAALLPPSLRTYGATGRSTVAATRTRAARLPKPRRSQVRSTIPAGGCGSACIRQAATFNGWPRLTVKDS
jgi:hypothetical protein